MGVAGVGRGLAGALIGAALLAPPGGGAASAPAPPTVDHLT
jgi:hypothetical protein